MKKIHYFCFQVFFFTASIFFLHLALFDFIGNYRNGVYTDWNDFTTHFLNWLPILIFDLIIGFGIGLFNGFCLILFGENSRSLTKAIILTDIFWLLFCFWWYFDNRGVINVEAVGHLLSPFIVGFVGFILALTNLVFFAVFSKPNKV